MKQETKVIEVKFVTQTPGKAMHDGELRDTVWVEEEALYAVQAPGFVQWEQGDLRPEEFDFTPGWAINGSSLTVYGLEEARQYITLLGKIVEHYEQTELEKKKETV